MHEVSTQDPSASLPSSPPLTTAEDAMHILHAGSVSDHDLLSCEETALLDTVTLPPLQQHEQLDTIPDDLLSWSPPTPTTPTLAAQQDSIAAPAILARDLFTSSEDKEDGSGLQRSPRVPVRAASLTDMAPRKRRLTSPVWSDQSAPTLNEARAASDHGAFGGTMTRSSTDGLEEQNIHCDTISVCVGQMWETTTVWASIVNFCDLRTVCELMRTCRRVRQQSTRNSVWRPILNRLDVAVFAPTYGVSCSSGENDGCGASDVERDDLYGFFVHDIITTRAIHGHYTCKSASRKGGQSGNATRVDCVTLLISPAAFGHLSHRVGRVQLLLKYNNDTMEVLQGACRFSIHQHCFIFCCNLFSVPGRGPEFKVSASVKSSARAAGHAAAAVTSGKGRSSTHMPTLRLTLVPMLRNSSGSQITQADIITVNRIMHKPTRRPKPNAKDKTQELQVSTCAH